MEPVAGTDLQEEVLSYLGTAAAHKLPVAPLRIDTHCSVAFLAGDDVYKVKRAIKLPFLDYSTIEKRKYFCELEFTINRKLSPDLYRGVVAITRAGQGFELGGCGEVVEWAVHLRRFDENQTLDRLAEAGELDLLIIRDLAAAVSKAHADARTIRNGHATEALGNVVEETLNELAQAPDVFPRREVTEFGRSMRMAFREMRGPLMIREATGHVRRCHGDLHLRNIVMVDDKVSLFDAIEFDEAIATTDILYDLAFLLMDLWEKDLKGEANVVLNRYLWQSGDMIDMLSGLSALPLFMSLRAAIRAKIAALHASPTARHRSTEARLYFETAREFLEPCRPSLIAIGGRSGTGKSTLASSLAPHIGRPPGAIHLRSDIERKREFHVAETTRLPSAAYRPEASCRVYEALERQAAAALASGQSVIVDATFLDTFEANAVAQIAKHAKADFRGIWLDAPTGLLMRRLHNRTNDASDATAAVLRAQPTPAPAPEAWICLDASRSAGDTCHAAMRCLRLQPQPVRHLAS